MPPSQPLDAAAFDTGKYVEQDGTKYVVTDSFSGGTGSLLLLTEVNDEGEPQQGTRVVPSSIVAHHFDVADVELPDPANQPAPQADTDRIAALEQQIARLSQPGPGGADQSQSGGVTSDQAEASGNESSLDLPPADQRGDAAPDSPSQAEPQTSGQPTGEPAPGTTNPQGV